MSEDFNHYMDLLISKKPMNVNDPPIRAFYVDVVLDEYDDIVGPECVFKDNLLERLSERFEISKRYGSYYILDFKSDYRKTLMKLISMYLNGFINVEELHHISESSIGDTNFYSFWETMLLLIEIPDAGELLMIYKLSLD